MRKVIAKICLLRFREYKEFKIKHLRKRIWDFPGYLYYRVPKNFGMVKKFLEARKGLPGRMPQWVIRALMLSLAGLIILDLFVLVLFALGMLAEPVVSIPSINNNLDNVSHVSSIKPALQSFWTNLGRKDIVSLVTILAVLLAGMLLTSIFKEEEGLLVPPFNVELSGNRANDAESEDNGLSDKVIRDQFIANLNKILWIHNTEHKRIDPEMIHAENETLPTINPTSESLTYSLADLGTIAIDPVTLPIGQILMMLRQLFPGANPGKIVKGSLHQCGSEIRLVATIGPKGGPKGSFSWEVRRDFKDNEIDHEKIFELISDLSYQIAFEFIPDSSPNNWAAFKYFTEALCNYHQYTLAKDDRSLKLARDYALKAVTISPDYEKVFPLIYNLGIAYGNKKWYEEAEKLFRMLVILKRDSYAYRGWGMSLRRLREDEMALLCYESALEILEKNSDLHLSPPVMLNKGVSCRREGNLDKAIECFEKALENDPDYGFAWGNLGNTLEAKGRLLKSKALYMLLEALKEDARIKGQVNKVADELAERRMTEDEALEKLVEIVDTDRTCCCTEREGISDSLERLSGALRKTRIAGQIETEGQSLWEKSKAMAKILRSMTAETKDISEDKRKSLVKSCETLAELLKDLEEILIDLDVELKEKCDSIKDQCEKIPEILEIKGEVRRVRANDLAETIETASESIEKYGGKIKAEAIEEMYKALTEVFHILGKSIGKREAFEEKVLKALGDILKSKRVSREADTIIKIAEDAEKCKTRAIEAYLNSVRLNPEYIVVRSSLARLYKKDGEMKKREDECRAAEELIRKENEYNRACHYAICGDMAEAYESLRRGLARKQTSISWLEQDPDLEDLRKDSRFAELRQEFKDEEARSNIRQRISRAAIYRKLHDYKRKKSECEKLRQDVLAESPYTRALFEAVCGNDPEKALSFLEIALREKQTTPNEVMGDPDFEFIRDEPEFRSLLERYSE